MKDIDRWDGIFENGKLEATPVTRRYSLLDVNSIDYNVVKCNLALTAKRNIWLLGLTN
jgi:hypothetical protein